jgi:glucosylglycerate synthase
MLDTSLRNDEIKRLQEIGGADLVVGIPTFRNAATIVRVMKPAVEGMHVHFPQLRCIIAIADGLSNDGTLDAAATVPMPSNVRRIVTSYQGTPGRGSGVRAILEMSQHARAKACILLDPTSSSLTPQWIKRFATPILQNEFDFVLPAYTRPLGDSGVSDLIAYPITRLLYGVDARQAMPGDLALSGALAARWYERDVWETDVAREGVDIWMTTVAIHDQARMCQTWLGTKIAGPREFSAAMDPLFEQSVGTLFRLMDIYHRRWMATNKLRSIPFCGDGPMIASEPQRQSRSVTIEMLNMAFVNGARRYRRVWRSVMLPSHLKEVLELANEPRGATHLSRELWPRVVFDFAVVYNKGENDPDKVVAALLPIYYARVATVLRESGAKADALEKAIQIQAEAFRNQRSYLLQRWEHYVPWAMDGVR